ncbi:MULTISPECIES: hypothetical protein [Fictibacillus]|uniref:Uncharacterized protein n=1 Tax=Fictibacillus terranigra TaxID=3058424 RepID=A0ABT8E7T9_9BACL|nr:hypothetical protein [Fictibacillus sp. CENA-BCM004]MDN4073966.1 hypothetical protein [Fictibacillus sp. CENA-BCM004]
MMDEKNKAEKKGLEGHQNTAEATDGLNQVLELINAKGNTRRLNDAVKDKR